MQKFGSISSLQHSSESVHNEQVSQPTANSKGQVNERVQEVAGKYPPNAQVTKLDSPLEIKREWLYQEWDPKCQFSRCIQASFPNRQALDRGNQHPNINLINTVFNQVRGKYALWQKEREEGRWKKVEVAGLSLDWVKENVKVLYPADSKFAVSELQGIVLWRPSKGEKYHLYEGNHRLSAWLANNSPQSLPATIYIGKPKKVVQV